MTDAPLTNAAQVEPTPVPTADRSGRSPRRRFFRLPSRRRLLVWCLVLATALGAAAAIREFRFRRPEGSGPAGPKVPLEAFRQTWTSATIHLYGAGDSITAGLGANAPSRSFFHRLVSCPDNEYAEMRGICLSAVLPGLTWENAARSGTNSLDHLESVRQNLRQFPADTFGLVVLTSGGNDLIHWYGTQPPRAGAMYGATLEQAGPWIREYSQRLDALLDLIRSRFPGGCFIFIGDIYDPTDGVGDALSAGLPPWPDGLAIHREYNRVIREAAASRPHVKVVPLYDTFLGHGTHCRQFYRPTYCREDPTFWYYRNIEDPNDRGHDAVRRAFLNEILKIRDQLPAAPSDDDSPPSP